MNKIIVRDCTKGTQICILVFSFQLHFTTINLPVFLSEFLFIYFYLTNKPENNLK